MTSNLRRGDAASKSSNCLDEAGGASANDASGSGRPGAYLGAPSLGLAGVVAGNSAAGFNGVSQYGQVPFDGALNPAQFSVEAWAKPTGGAGSYRSVVTSRTGSFGGYILYAGLDDHWQFWLGTGSAWRVVTGPVVALNVWTHLVGTFDGTTARLYINGAPAGSAPVAAFAANTSAPLRFAAGRSESTPSFFLAGSLDELAIYGSALSAARIQAHYAASASLPGAPTGVTASAGDSQASVSWVAPASDGGSPITGYDVTPYVGGVASGAATVVGAVTSTTVTGLSNGTTYTFKVAARNAAGTGLQSAESNAVTPAAVVDGYASTVAADSPAGYWRLGEPSGTTAADASGSGRPGAYLGAPSLGLAGVVAGNPAAGFNGVSQYGQVPFDGALNPAQFSVEAWAKPTGGAGSYRSVVTSRTGSFGGYILYAGLDDHWQFWLGTGSAWRVVTGPVVALNVWTHLVGTFDGTTARLYINGAPAGSAPVAAFAANTSAPLRFAAGRSESTPSFFLAGSLDELAIYGSALSAARIQAHYNAAAP